MRRFLDEISSRLAEAGIENPRSEARLLAASVLKTSPGSLLFDNRTLSAGEKEQINAFVAERLHHKPVCKILGQKGFYKFDFKVSEDVLSPRPDTEVLVEAAIEAAAKLKKPKILDLGTGSGCIIISVLADVPQALGTAVDKSGKALAVAEENSRRLNVDSRLNFINASWFDDDFVRRIGTEYDLIVSNPPYIPSGDIDGLEEDVKNYDPLMALDGGADGMEHYRRIAEVSVKILKPGGLIFLEGGINQERQIEEIFVGFGFSALRIIKDLAGINRCIILKK